MTHGDSKDDSVEGDDRDGEARDGEPSDGEPRDGEPRDDRRRAPKERVLHTRVPAVLEQELKQLAKNLRVPVSNVVRAILEDAVEAVDAVGDIAQGELQGFAERLSRQRSDLRARVAKPARKEEPIEDAEVVEPPEAPCPSSAPAVLDGVYGYQSLVVATDTACTVCGRPLSAGSSASRALFDEPGRRVFLGAGCRLVPGPSD